MAHVDDGELEMVLDGALHLLPPERAAEVRRYVEATPEGARRLEEARVIRARSEEILGGMGRVSTPVPDFEEVRARAASAGPGADAPRGGAPVAPAAPPRVRRRTPLLWAASVAVALGAGWLGRGLLTDAGTPGRLADGASPAAESAASAPAPSAARALAVPPEGPESPPPSTASATPSQGAAGGPGVAGVTMDRTAVEAEPAEGPAVQAPGTAATLAEADLFAQRSSGGVAAPPLALAEADLFAAAPVADPEVLVALLPLSPPETWPAGWERLAPPVPGFPVLEVALSGDTTLVTQALPDGAVLELRYWVPVTADGEELWPITGLGVVHGRVPVPPAPAGSVPLATDPIPGAPAPRRGPGEPAPDDERAKAASDLQISDTVARLGLPVAGGWLDLQAPVADSVLRRWGAELAERRGRAVP